MAGTNVNKRLDQLEESVKRLEAELRRSNPDSLQSWIATAGTFANDPAFDEIVRLGRQYRQSLRPKRRRGKA